MYTLISHKYPILVPLAGLVPLAETPRWTIINCPFCLTGRAIIKFRKAKRSLPFAAPTLKSVQMKRETKRDNPKLGYPFLVPLAGLEPARCFHRGILRLEGAKIAVFWVIQQSAKTGQKCTKNP